MPNPILRGFAGVLRFRGRDTRAQFWPYAGAAFALYLVVSWAVLVAIMVPIMTAPSLPTASVQSVVGPFLTVSLAGGAALVALLAAAVARRLHDSGVSALFGLMPLPFLAYSGTMFGRIVSQFETGSPDDRLFMSVFVSNLLYLIGVAILVLLLALRSAPGPNRYGEQI